MRVPFADHGLYPPTGEPGLLSRLSLRNCGLKSTAIALGALLLTAVIGCEKKEEAPKPMPPEVEVTEVISRAKFLELAGGKMPEDQRKLLDEVLKKDGYVLKVEVKNTDGKQLSHWICFVASPNGEAKVVGLKD